jgi:hypothetical protein
VNKHLFYFLLFFILLLTFNSHGADKRLVHLGEPQNHIASVELIESLPSRSEGDSNTPGKETLITHLCNGYLTAEQLIVSGRQAKRVRSHLSGKLSAKQSDLSSYSRRRIKIFTQNAPKGAAYIDKIPPELLQIKWSNEELVALPLNDISLAQSTWKNLNEVEDAESESNVVLFSPENLTYDTYFNGERTLLTLYFQLNELSHCTSKSCHSLPENAHSFLINKNTEGGLFVGAPTQCEVADCPVTRYIRTESQLTRDAVFLTLIFITLTASYLLLNSCCFLFFATPGDEEFSR